MFHFSPPRGVLNSINWHHSLFGKPERTQTLPVLAEVAASWEGFHRPCFPPSRSDHCCGAAPVSRHRASSRGVQGSGWVCPAGSSCCPISTPVCPVAHVRICSVQPRAKYSLLWFGLSRMAGQKWKIQVLLLRCLPALLRVVMMMEGWRVRKPQTWND
eukprot:289204-Rhodomonas_salina.2